MTSGLKLSKSNRATELKFLGHIISERGIEPNPEKISGIVDMPRPTNKKELQWKVLTKLNQVFLLVKNTP